MLTKESIAKNINGVKDLARIITTNFKLGLTEGQIYDNRGKAESWSNRDKCTKSFMPETSGQIMYVLYCNSVPCHEIDYNNLEICESLGAVDCQSEAECLVSSDTKMLITYVSDEHDFKEMGYYTVELELIE